MTTYNTGNPVPSGDARDRFDNTQTLDELINSLATETITRTGRNLLTYEGMSAQFNFSQAQRAEIFKAFLDASGFSSLGEYAAGISIVSHSQTVDYQGQPYALKATVPASIEAPYVTTGNWAVEGAKFKLVGDSSLRQDLASPGIGKGIDRVSGGIRVVDNLAGVRSAIKLTGPKAVFALGHTTPGDGGGGPYVRKDGDTTSTDDNGSMLVGSDGVRIALQHDGKVVIEQFGAVANTDFFAQLDAASLAIFNSGGGEVLIRKSYLCGSKILMRPGVTITGPASGYRARINFTFSNGICVETVVPAGVPGDLCLGSGLNRLSLIGTGTSSGGVCVDLRNAMQCSISGNEIANFYIGIRWNRGHTPETFVQTFLCKVSQNIFKSCLRGHEFNGAANRNAMDTNSYADCEVGYDFSRPHNWSETNTFTGENVEGCKFWAIWGDSIYSQTWINLCVENPSHNGYVCRFIDPGRQVFVNLSLIPLGEKAAINYELADPDQKPSMRLGSAASSGNNRLGMVINEELHIYDVVSYHAGQVSGLYTGTVPANGYVEMAIPMAGAVLNDRLFPTALRFIGGCSLQAYATEGFANVVIINGTNSAVTMTGVGISVLRTKFE